MQLDLLSYAEAVRVKEAALSQVTENAGDWMSMALLQLRESVRSFPAEFLAETIRQKLAPLVGHPHTHHAWGALTQKAIRLGIIFPTGEFRTTLSKKTHGHKTAVYRAA